MKSWIIINSIIGFCFLLLSCNNTDKIETADLRGVWQAIVNDSIYEEVIISDKDFYVYDDRAGDLYFRYAVENDSITLLRDNTPYLKRKIVHVSNDEFFLIDSLFRIRLTRLIAPVDTGRLMTLRNWKATRDYDAEYYSEYVWELRGRRYFWDSVRNASR